MKNDLATRIWNEHHKPLKELYAVIADDECIGRATHLDDAKDIARRWNGKVYDTKAELKIGRFYNEDHIIGEVVK